MLMKNKIISMLVILASLSAKTSAQTSTASFDHIAIYVRDLEVSKQFYSRLFHFDSLPHPVMTAYKFYWFSIGNHQAFHLVEGLKDTIAAPFMLHNCFSVPSIDAITKQLDQLSIPYYSGPDLKRGARLREDGVKQIFIKDPDKYWVEINDAKY